MRCTSVCTSPLNYLFEEGRECLANCDGYYTFGKELKCVTSCSGKYPYLIEAENVCTDNCKEKKYYSHCQPIKRIVFTLDDKKVVTIGGKDKSIFIWEIQQD